MRYVGHKTTGKTEGKGGPDATGSGRSAAIYRHRGYRQYHRRSGECPSGPGASASERLRKMEAEIGVPLLHRQLCPRGDDDRGREVLARHARPLLAQQQRLRQAMHAFACGQRGTLRLFANTSAIVGLSAGEARRLDGSAPGGCRSNRRTHQRGYRQLYPGGRGAGRSGVRCGRPRAAAPRSRR